MSAYYNSTMEIQGAIDELVDEIECLIPEDHDYDLYDVDSLKTLDMEDNQPMVTKLVELLEFKSSFNDYNSDWNCDVELVLDWNRIDNMRTFMEEIGDRVPDYVVVDWEATSNNFYMDWTYSSIDGVDYWYQSC